MKMLRYIVALTATVALVACDLNEHPDYFTNRAEMFRSEGQCRAAVNSCYLNIDPIYSSRMFQITEGCVDTGLTWATTLDPVLDISPAYPRHGSTIWEQCYKGVMRCNYAVEGLESSTIDNKELLGELIAEAKIMRALYYYVLTCSFGDVPYYTVDVSSKKILLEVQHLPRTSAIEIRSQIIADLEDDVVLLEQVKGSDVEEYRAGAALGWMLIAKMAMWNASKDEMNAPMWWDKGVEALVALQNIYGALSTYTLEDSFQWHRKNTPESIFEIQHTYVAGGVNYTSSIAPAAHPTHTTGTMIYDGIEIEWLGDNGVNYSQVRPTAYFFQELQPRGGVDKRTTYNLAWEWQGQQFNGTATRPWVGIKLWCPDMYHGYDHNNYKIFRYADALLMLAECYAEIDKPTLAVQCLNEVKERAGIDTYIYSSLEELQEEIRAERARELFGECHRKFDLVRWGVWYERTLEFHQNSTLLKNIKPCHEYYPIPDVQVSYSGGALTNDEYKKYGL